MCCRRSRAKTGRIADRLRDVDYLSTVSGGGYIGASLTWFNYLQRAVPAKDRQFPFGSKYEAHRDQCATEISVDNAAFIRQHGEYMTPAKRFTSVSLIAVALRNIVLCFSVYFALVAALTLAARLAHTWWVKVFPGGWLGDHVNETMMPAVLLLLLFAALSIVFGMATAIIPKIRPDNEVLYGWRVRSQRYFGLVLAWAFAAFICGTVPHAYDAIEHWTATNFALSTTGTAGVIYEFLKQQRPKLAVATPKLNIIILWVTVLAIIYGLLLGAYALARELDDGATNQWLPLYFVGYAVLVGGVMNSNMFSIGRMYRDRLMEAFMPNRRGRGAPQMGSGKTGRRHLRAGRVHRKGQWPVSPREHQRGAHQHRLRQLSRARRRQLRVLADVLRLRRDRLASER